MVFFRVTQNINVKATDGTLVKYMKLKKPSELLCENIYCTTYNDINAIKTIFEKLGPSYKLRVINEEKIISKIGFPKELGISNKNEYSNLKKYGYEIDNNQSYIVEKKDKYVNSFFLNEKPSVLHKQIKINKKDINIAIIGGVGKNIGEIINSLSAVRILYEQLQKKFNTVKIDMYLLSSDNSFYSRDKDMMKKEYYINEIFPLSISVKKLCEYDFYVDNSSTMQCNYYQNLPYVDANLHKFGIDYKKISNIKKHNHIDISAYQPKEELVTKINELKLKGELLLYHPYSPDISRSIPEDTSILVLKKLIKKCKNSTVVTLLELSKFIDDSYANLSSYSKTYYDFVYIISRMDKVITVDTSVYHISDAFFIPTVVLFTTQNPEKRIKYYSQTKAIQIVDQTQHFSQFIFEDDTLILHKFKGWSRIKVGQVIKLLETIR